VGDFDAEDKNRWRGGETRARPFLMIVANGRLMREGDTIQNALIGGAVAIVTAVVLGPVSSVLGGGVAGYLQRGTTTDGAVVGAASGLVALVPLLLLFGLFAAIGIAPAIGLFGGFPAGPMGPPEGFAAGSLLVGVLFLFVAAIVAVSVVGLGAIGGVAGAYVATETDLGA